MTWVDAFSYAGVIILFGGLLTIAILLLVGWLKLTLWLIEKVYG